MLKTIDDYTKLSYRMEICEDPDEGGFVISYPELSGCITCGETIEEALEMAKDAKREWIRAAIEENYEIPLPNQKNTYSGQFKLRLPKSLHKELSEHARSEGISMNQYCVYLLSKTDAVHSYQSASAQS